MPLLMATSTFGLWRRRWSSPQQCYLHSLYLCDPYRYIYSVFGIVLDVLQEEREKQEVHDEAASSRVDQLNSLLVRYICSEALSFDVVESESFRYR